jgi:hypothetical protein
MKGLTINDPAFLFNARVYVMAQDFELGVAPPLWTDVNAPDWLGSAIAGKFSLRLSSNATWADWVSPVNYSELYTFFKFRVSALPGAQVNMFNFQTSAAATQLQVNLNSDGTINLKHGTTSVTTVGAIAANTVYHFWIHYRAGSGANGVGSLGFSLTETEATSGNNFTSTSAGTATGTIGLFDPENTSTAATFDFFFDKVRLDVNPIGSNPP